LAGQLAVDFGTSNTVIARWDPAEETGRPILVEGYGVKSPEGIPIIPSLIHYAPGGEVWIGNEVLDRNLQYDQENTFRLMKRYISNKAPEIPRNLGNGIKKTFYEAGGDFLRAVLEAAAAYFSIEDDEVAFSVPVEAYEHYADWLTTVAQSAGMPRVRLIDEPSAAALGYGTNIQPGQVYLVFDFGGGTLDVMVAIIEEEDSTFTGHGRRCRVLGKAGLDLGGSDLDQYLFEKLLEKNNKRATDPDIEAKSGELFIRCEEAKKRLSDYENAEVTVVDPETGELLIGANFTRSEYEDLLDEHDVLRDINKTIRDALNGAEERGYGEGCITTALMVGGSSYTPAVRRVVEQFFGRERVRLDRPMDAVARGACSLVAGIDFFDHIQHTYTLRSIDIESNDYKFTDIVPKGTTYPSDEPVFEKFIRPISDGQKDLGIAIFERGETPAKSSSQKMEVVYDPKGSVRLSRITADDREQRSMFWINKDNPTFLKVRDGTPDTKKGENRFKVEFNISDNKHLLITARDLYDNKLIYKDYPVIKLS